MRKGMEMKAALYEVTIASTTDIICKPLKLPCRNKIHIQLEGYPNPGNRRQISVNLAPRNIFGENSRVNLVALHHCAVLEPCQHGAS